MRQAMRLRIYAQWSQESGSWTASSTDIHGLAAEAVSLEALEARLEQILPELMQVNGLQGQAALIVDSAF